MPNDKKFTQKLSIRLLQDGVEPEEALRPGSPLKNWDKLPGAKIIHETVGGKCPRWTKFLQLSDAAKEGMVNNFASALVFVYEKGRWFSISFGLGHVRIDPEKIEQDFGLIVTLNMVDVDNLKSADSKTLDENTVTRRSQTSRSSKQDAFGIDVERDIVRGVSGTPKDKGFGSKVSGSDSLNLLRKASLEELPQICEQALAAYTSDAYKQGPFAWIDKIKFVRDKALISTLDDKLVEALQNAIDGGLPDDLHLAYPIIYDPDNSKDIRYKGFDCHNLHSDLDINDYIVDLQEKSIKNYSIEFLADHTVHEVNDSGVDIGEKWKIRACVVYEVDYNGNKYIISDNKWYCVESDLVKSVEDFFKKSEKIKLPDAKENENESTYNLRIAGSEKSYLCLDRRIIKPTGATSGVEVCDFFADKKIFIHVKDKTSSSRLSHLFSQGIVPAKVLILDGGFRDKINAEIVKQQKILGRTGFDSLIPKSNAPYAPSDYKVVFGVITSSKKPKLPFFSLVTFKQAATELISLGYKCAFGWIVKPVPAKI